MVNLFSALALAIATLTSVNHSTSAAKAGWTMSASPRRVRSQRFVFIIVTAILEDICPKSGHLPPGCARNCPHIPAVWVRSGNRASLGGLREADPQKTRKKCLQPGFGLLPSPFLLKGN